MSALHRTIVHCCSTLVCRWVRDKLLGRENSDIDITLDNTSGPEFAQCVNQLLVSRGLPVSSIGVIQANPGQSKHLETATVKLYQQDIDFVNLRSEDYANRQVRT